MPLANTIASLARSRATRRLGPVRSMFQQGSATRDRWRVPKVDALEIFSKRVIDSVRLHAP